MYLIGLVSCASGKDLALHQDVKGSWDLQKTKDSYTGAWVESTSSMVFTFGDTGRFVERDNNKECIGSFLKVDSIYEVSHSCNQVKLRYRLEKIDDKNMLLSRQGRHGKVFYFFEKQ